MHRNAKEKLGHVASPKNLVHSGKMGCTLFRIKIRSKDTTRNAFPPEELASPTRATSTAATAAAATTTAHAHVGVKLYR